MSGKLSTHVLDAASGHPAAGIDIELWSLDDERRPVVRVVTNDDGRSDGPLLEGESMHAGAYRLVFGVGDYYRRLGHPDAGRFLDRVVVEFRIDDPAAGYHVPLLVTPWSYSTYRGS